MNESRLKKTRRSYLVRTVSILLITLLIGTPPYAVAPESYSVHRSSATVRQRLRSIRKKILKPARKVLDPAKHTLQKYNKPAARIEAPHPEAMPISAPVMPPAPKMPETLQPNGAEVFFRRVARVMVSSWKDNIFVWLPAISTDPNADSTYGILPVLVLSDTKKHIRHLLAPSYTYNELFGQTGTGRYYFYPTDNSQLVAIGSFSERTNREAKLRYENTAAFEGALYVRGEAWYSVDGSKRFFGIGPQTHEGDEMGYTGKDASFRGVTGINFFKNWRTTFGLRFHRAGIDHNIIPHISDLLVRSPNLVGTDFENTSVLEYRLLWDTRDIPVTPSSGSSGEFFAEKTMKTLGSDADFIRYGLEGKRFFAWSNPRHVTVLHGLYEWANGPRIPFYELPSLGGRETLRGYGEGRLADRGRVVINLEHRITIASLPMMGIQTNFEVAPFFDLGSVFPTAPEMQRKNFRPVYGAAFRAAVKPNVVGAVDVGIGKEGPAVFVGINYPF